MKYFLAFCVTFVTLIFFDFLWIGFFAHAFYYKSLSAFLAPQVNFAPAIAFYALYTLALLFFVVFPALRRSSGFSALFIGAFFGFTAYMTYDLTNLALFTNWPLTLSLVDIAWGTGLSGVASLITYLVLKEKNPAT